MDLNTVTGELTAESTKDTKLVTIRSLLSIMGILQSPALLHLCVEDLTTDIKDDILKYFLKYMRYLNDLQTGLVAEEILELQRQVDLSCPDLSLKCDDKDCCSPEEDNLPSAGGEPGPGQGGNMTLAGWDPWPGQGGNTKHEDLLGGSTPSDEKMSTRHP